MTNNIPNKEFKLVLRTTSLVTAKIFYKIPTSSFRFSIEYIVYSPVHLST